MTDEREMAEECDKHYVKKRLMCPECVVVQRLEAQDRAFLDGRGVERVRQAFSVKEGNSAGN